jgi:APA family basic amino acid/polyamine antiporter
MGLGSMVGTGVFVSIGIAAGVAGTAVIPAIAVAAFVALCNGMSSAQLAAAHPVSGGTYEYGYRYLKPWMGFAAGWMFLCAKSASAATAALGFSGYLLHLTGQGDLVPLMLPALGILGVMTLLVLSGLKRSNGVNVAIVSVTLISLLLFIVRALPHIKPAEHLGLEMSDLFTGRFLEGCALMFVAYTGYGRIATMGEEIRDPKRNIPRAILAVMGVTGLLYMGIAVSAVGAVGAEWVGEMTRENAAPLEAVLNAVGDSVFAKAVALGALTAMLGVLLNLLLGLSRVLLAMGRRSDMPVVFATLKDNNPKAAIVGVAGMIALIVLTGQVKVSWSFSAFTVLIYYSLTNLSALHLPMEDRLYPRFFSWCGLASCLFLAFQVEPRIWVTGLGVLGVGLLWHVYFATKRHKNQAPL